MSVSEERIQTLHFLFSYFLVCHKEGEEECKQTECQQNQTHIHFNWTYSRFLFLTLVRNKSNGGWWNKKYQLIILNMIKIR